MALTLEPDKQRSGFGPAFLCVVTSEVTVFPWTLVAPLQTKEGGPKDIMGLLEQWTVLDQTSLGDEYVGP